MEVTLDAQTVITFSALVGAAGGIIGVFCRLHKKYLATEELKREVAALKHENGLLCYGLSACLDGLMQLGANHSVPAAKEKLDKYLNERAHECGGGAK